MPGAEKLTPSGVALAIFPEITDRVPRLTVTSIVPEWVVELNANLFNSTVEFGPADNNVLSRRVMPQYAATLGARPQAPVSFILYFEFGSAINLAPQMEPVMAQLRAALASYPAAEITVIGHTDRVGSLESNDVLSLQRSETVRAFILKAGIDVRLIEVTGRGEREPLVPTADEVAEEKNRRVEINLR